MRAPDFWDRDSALARLLLPIAAGYQLLDSWNRRRIRPQKVAIPVICVGNLVTGGAGKTPVALALIEALKSRGRKVAALTRGYGGRQKGPLAVDPTGHSASEVGDEALLLAAATRTWLAADRVAGAKAAVAEGAEVLVMDDGFQNPGLSKDLSLLVVDGAYGFGNERLLPAGPLRETVNAGIARAQALVILGHDHCGLIERFEGLLPLLRAHIAPRTPAAVSGRRFVAFAGIGRPAKFFETLAECGAELVETVSFPDHHPYLDKEVDALLDLARQAGATAITTEKDAHRLPKAMRDAIEVLPVDVIWQEPDRLAKLIEAVLDG
jgi:tetraacyldisaccharide 4'-kinase